MKNSLIQHIKRIFETLEIQTEYSVFDINIDTLPEWMQNIELTHEFIICCNANFEKDKLQEFIHKDIFKANNWYYWFEGETRKDAEQQPDNIIVELLPSHPRESLKTTTRLPSWLDNFIFDTLRAEYAPDFKRFEYNLNLSYEENLKYLGTYFPRSYAETFCIFDNIFTNDLIKSKYVRLTEVNILSVGCGTGGDIMGILTILNKHFSSIKKVNVIAVDGNEDALNILSQIIQQFISQFNKNIVITTKQVVFDRIDLIDITDSFNFIITSKMINEIIRIGNGRLDNSYYDFVQAFSPTLKEEGFMLLLDVTTKVALSGFCPILLNRQVNQFLHEHPDLVSIIPIPCTNKDNCQTQCFSQKEFTITHSKCSSDKSRVTYRIIVKKTFSKGLLLRQENIQYQINENSENRYCGQGTVVVDGFYLPNITNKKALTIDDTNEKNASKPPASTTRLEPTVDNIPQNAGSDNQQFKNIEEAYIIDTNAFIYSPNIIDKIAENFPIFVSAKVVDELDHRKDVTSGNDKKKVQKALRSINIAISSGRVQTATSDVRLLPADFDHRSPDNLILSVVLKVKKMGYTPILVTSDNGFQAKAKTLKIKTTTYTRVKSKL